MKALLLFASAAALVAGPALAQQAGRSAPAKDAPAPNYSRGAVLQPVGEFPTQQITGVSVSHSGRVFVNLPRWTVDVPISVGEVKDGRITPFPNADWNGYRNTGGSKNRPKAQFVCVQSIVVDHQDNLWVLDPAAPGQMGPVKNGPKLVKIDLKTNKVARVVSLDEKAAPPGSYMNDVRFSPDDRFAYISDSGAKGAIVVVDLVSGHAWRVLDGDPSTQYDNAVIVHTDGHALRRPDGREPQFAADGIALSPDGRTFYWQALTGKTLYSVPTFLLQDPARAAGAKPTTVATTHPADGLWIDAAGHLYVTNPETNAVEMAERPGAALKTLVKDDRLRWPDTFSEGPDGTIYVSASHIQDSPWFRPQAKTTPSALFKIAPK